MKKSVILKAKTTVREIHWPSPKKIVTDTLYVAITATVVSCLIKLWSMGIETIIAEFIK